MKNHYEDELRINGKIYKKINGKWTLIEKSDIINYNGKTFRKIYDELAHPKIDWIILEENDKKSN